MALLALVALATAACGKREDLGRTRVDTMDHRPAPPMDDPNSASRIAPSREPRDKSLALYVLALFGAGSFVAMTALSAARHRKVAMLERSFDVTKPLANGPAMVFGKVEAAGGEVALLVRIFQRGTEGYNKKWRHQWTERDREVQVSDFIVRTSRGERVRVEVTKDVELRDPLTKFESTSRTERIGIADVRAGDEVFVVGELSGVRSASNPYREGESLPVLRASRGSKLIISSEVPGAADSTVARGESRWAIGAAGWLVLWVLAFSPSYSTLLTGYRSIETVPVDVGQWRVWIKMKGRPGGWQYHYDVRARASDGRVLQDEISRTLYDEVLVGSVTRLPFIVSVLRPSVAQYGTAPMARQGSGAIGALGAIMLWLSYLTIRSLNLPWYRQRKVTHEGSGKLRETNT